MTHLRILDIIDGTTVDGPGLRTSIYFAGCNHQCPGCHNPQSWDFGGGKDMPLEEIISHVIENDFNVTYTGGDPLYQLDGLIRLSVELKKIGKTIWCYTGFTYEQITEDSRLREILPYIDVMVDGPFMELLRDTHLKFRGSSNQRIIDIARSAASGTIELYDQ